MSDSEKTEADSTTTAEQYEKEDSGKSETPLSTNGKPENNLSVQLEEKIIRQVEYYFGDRNLPRDKFLQAKVAENEGGWVPIATLLTFNRLKALSSNPDYIVTALRKSAGNILEVNSEGTSVRRSPDNPPPDIFLPEQRQKMKDKTVYVKGFEEETKLDDIQSFFDQYGKLEHVQMRRNIEDKKFKGSVFAEFKEKTDAEKFLSLPELTFKGAELLRESKEAYYARKAEERRKVKEEKRLNAVSTTSKVETKGAVIHFKGSEVDTTREEIKEVMQEFATVAFIDYQKGDKEGYVRFEEENGASKALEGLKVSAAEGQSPRLCGANVELKILEGSEEEQYWVKALENRSKSKARGKKGGRGGRHGYQGGDRKRRHKSGEDVPVAKRPETEGKDNTEPAEEKSEEVTDEVKEECVAKQQE